MATQYEAAFDKLGRVRESLVKVGDDAPKMAVGTMQLALATVQIQVLDALAHAVLAVADSIHDLRPHPGRNHMGWS